MDYDEDGTLSEEEEEQIKAYLGGLLEKLDKALSNKDEEKTELYLEVIGLLEYWEFKEAAYKTCAAHQYTTNDPSWEATIGAYQALLGLTKKEKKQINKSVTFGKGYFKF